jgi:hypothetical protein
MALCAALAGQVRAQSPVVPIVTSAPIVMPSDIAHMASIAGDITLSVTTDGARVVKVDRPATNPMLVDAAVASVEQWQFAPHVPTTFTSTFRYRYKSAEMCPESDVETEVSARLPAEVNITTARFTVWSHGGPQCGAANDGKPALLADLTGTLTCECKGNAPIADALLIAWQPGAPTATTVRLRSDEHGRFSVPSIPRGHYFVDVHKPGFRFKRLLVSLVSSGPTEPRLNVTFRPEPHPDPIPAFVVPRQLPTYPEAARWKGIEGDVQLSRDVSGHLTILSGVPELATPALEHARSWGVQSPSPPLEVRYRYRLSDGDCEPNQNPFIEMRLPSMVVVTAKKPIVCLAGARARK